MAARGSTRSMLASLGLVLAISLACVSTGDVTIDEAVSQLKLAEAKAAPYAFEVEAKMQYLDPKTDGEVGTQHFKITYDQAPFRRCRLSVFHAISPWPDNPSGSGLCDNTGEYAILGDSYQSLLLSTGDPDPELRAHPLEGKTSSKTMAHPFDIAFIASGWRGSLLGVTFFPRSPSLSGFIERCVDAKQAGKAGAIAEVSSEDDGLVKLRLCADSRLYLYEVTLDPKKDMAVTRWSEIYPKNGQVSQDVEVTELSEVAGAGLFYPKRLVSRDFDSAGNLIGKSQSEITHVRLLRKESLSDADFQIDWPVGSKITNEDTGETAVIGSEPEEEETGGL